MSGSAAAVSHYQILDYPATLSVPDPEARAAVHAILQGFVQPDHASESAQYALFRDERGAWCVDACGSRAYEGETLGGALVTLEWRLMTDMLTFCPNRFHLHGAALCTPSGRESVLLLGASGAGKTTLALALLERGFLPFADDVIFLDPDTLAPGTFCRAFHVDDSTRALLSPSWHARTRPLEGMPPGYFMPSRWAEREAPVRAVFFPAAHPGATPTVTPLSIADATAKLLPFSLTLGQAPELALSVAADLTRHAACYALVSGDLPATADLVATVSARVRYPAWRRGVPA